MLLASQSDPHLPTRQGSPSSSLLLLLWVLAAMAHTRSPLWRLSLSLRELPYLGMSLPTPPRDTCSPLIQGNKSSPPPTTASRQENLGGTTHTLEILMGLSGLHLLRLLQHLLDCIACKQQKYVSPGSEV